MGAEKSCHSNAQISKDASAKKQGRLANLLYRIKTIDAMKTKQPIYKKGDVVLSGRIICEVNPCLDHGGKPSFRYGYRYEGESETLPLLYCMESTILRRTY